MGIQRDASENFLGLAGAAQRDAVQVHFHHAAVIGGHGDAGHVGYLIAVAGLECAIEQQLTFGTLDGDAHITAGAQEALYWALQELLRPGDHAIVTVPNYQSLETIPLAVGASMDLHDYRVTVTAISATAPEFVEVDIRTIAD